MLFISKKEKYARWNQPRAKYIMCDIASNLLSYPELALFNVNIDHYDRNQF